MKKKFWLWIVIALVVVLIGVRVAAKRRSVKTAADLPIAVSAAAPRVGGIEDVIALSGSVSAEEEANAYSKVPGKLAKYLKAEGDWVAKDEPIALVERDEIGLTYSLSPVKAPIAGVVAQKFLEIGASVSPGGGAPGTPVAQVVNPQRLEVVVNVVERDMAKVRIGQPARIRVEAYPDRVFTGWVKRIAPVVDRLSKTTRVVVGVNPAEGRLKPGMFADAEIVASAKANALLLPREALLKQDQQLYVYVMDNGRATRRPVAVGWSQGAEVEIVSGVSRQDRVVVEGQTRLTEGSRIQAAGEK